MDAKPNLVRRLDAAVFDDRSPHLDRFGLLLATVIATLGGAVAG